MHSADGDIPPRKRADRANVHDRPRSARAAAETFGRALLIDSFETEKIDEKRRGRRSIFLPQRDAVNAANGHLPCDSRRAVPAHAVRSKRSGDDLEHQTVAVFERQHLLVDVARASHVRADVLHAVTQQSLDPESQRVRRDRERRHGNLAWPNASALRARPRKKGDQAARMSNLIAVVKMVCLWIIEVDGALHQSQPKHAGVEVDVALRVTADRGDVMNAGGPHLRRLSTRSAG